jgi:UDP-N-acetylglucosamine 4-epimerase
VVSGVAGFIGSALLEELLRLKQNVIGLDNYATGHKRNLDLVRSVVPESSWAQFQIIEGDICDLETCQRACDGATYVLHQAALGSVPRSIEDPIASHHANVTGFLNMALASRDAQVARFVYASSSSVYGDQSEARKRETQLGKALSPYALTKRIDELYAEILQDSYDLKATGLRYFNVFGRRQDSEGAYAAVIPRWLGNLIAGKTCQIYGDGSRSRDFCYVDNAVQANILAATSGDERTAKSIYNVGCDLETNLLDLYLILRDAVAEAIPSVAGREAEHTDPRPGDVAHSRADISKIKNDLGYNPTHNVKEGLRETVAWYLENLRNEA